MNRWIIIFGLFILAFQISSFLQLRAQIFPLKIRDGQNYFVTKNNVPFLINARSTTLFRNTEETTTNLTRLKYQSVNALFVVFNTRNIKFNAKGKPDRLLKQNLTALKILIRQAELLDMAVLVSPLDSLNTISADFRSKYFSLLSGKLNRFRNILWLFDKDIEASVFVKTSQLKGLACHFNDSYQENQYKYNFRVISDTSQISSVNKLTIIKLKSDLKINDTLAYNTRNKAYSAFLKGSSGIILEPSGSIYNPINYQMKQLKEVFDSINWYDFKKFPDVVSKDELNSKNYITSAIRADSTTVLYFAKANTISLNLSKFTGEVNLSWINPINGTIYKATVNTIPPTQLFLPPSANNNVFNDWLLIIQPSHKN